MAQLTQDEKDAIRDAGVAQWWVDWFKADYSWDGLTQFEWDGWIFVKSKVKYKAYIKAHGLPKGCPNTACQVVPADYDGFAKRTVKRPATLQDYWRDQEDHLEETPGQKKYTIAHLPIHYKNGHKSWKADPGHENWKTLSTLVAERLGCGTRTEVSFALQQDLVSLQDGRANFRGCVLPSLPSRAMQSNADGKIRPTSDTAGALHLSLFQANIVQPQSFTSAIFGSPTNFIKSIFSSGDVDFEFAQFLGGDADFTEARFSGGNVYFTDAQFLDGLANFSRAQFSGGMAFFFGTEFSFREANFFQAVFSGGDAIFREAEFSGGFADFREAKFLGGKIDFNRSQFSGGLADFREAQFSGGNTDFGNAQFDKTFDYNDARFEKTVSFENANFPPALGSQSAFRGTQFHGPANFLRTVFQDKNGAPLSEAQLHFPFNAFDHSNIKDQLILTERGDAAAQIEFDHALRSISNACQGEDREAIEARYVALQQGCTTLKRAMENISDKTRAQRYFKFELLARQQRPTTPRIVKFFTKLYGWTADYGGSMSRPLWTLLVVWLVFAFGYGLHAGYAEVKTPQSSIYSGALDFSATQISRPLFVWSKTMASGDMSWPSQYKNALNAGGWLTIKLLATIQSFLSITLLFLFGLATKRKFQIR